LAQCEQRLNDFSWNTETDIKIMPALHGTAEAIAENICSNGFASLALLDGGWFGQGMYFTTNALYTLTYCATRENPTIIICYAIMGNVYPVVSNNEFLGKPLATGFDSHFVVTNPGGKTCSSAVKYDEIVIGQEDQVIPAYLVTLDKSGISSKVKDIMWSRCPKSITQAAALPPEEIAKKSSS